MSLPICCMHYTNPSTRCDLSETEDKEGCSPPPPTPFSVWGKQNINALFSTLLPDENVTLISAVCLCVLSAVHVFLNQSSSCEYRSWWHVLSRQSKNTRRHVDCVFLVRQLWWVDVNAKRLIRNVQAFLKKILSYKNRKLNRIIIRLWCHSNIFTFILIVASKQHSLYTSFWEEDQKHIEVIASNVLWPSAILIPPTALTITAASYDLTQRPYYTFKLNRRLVGLA